MTQKRIAHYRTGDKKPHYLEEHLIGVADLAGKFASKLGCGLAGELLGLVHDYGKYSSRFQSYLGSATGLIEPDADDYVDGRSHKGRIDHSTAGAQLIWQEFSKRDQTSRYVAQILALCIASHHSGLIDCLSSSNAGPTIDNFARRMKKAHTKTHFEEVAVAADSAVLSRFRQLMEDPSLSEQVLRLLKDIERLNPSAISRAQQFGLAARMLFSCLIDADRIDSADFENEMWREERPTGEYAPWTMLSSRLEKHLSGLEARESGQQPIDDRRRAISDACLTAADTAAAGVYTLSAPTGAGKTLASLRFALHHAARRRLDRVIYVVPYTSIIDQNAADVRAVLEPDEAVRDKGRVVLEHHSNLTPERQTWREKMLCENWDAPVVFTTMVQFLEALFGGGTRGARRMHQLANAVLIFDEIQTLPVKCVHMFNNAVNFLSQHCKSTVLLCTATQPLLQEVDASKGAVRLSSDSELMPDVGGLFQDLRRVRILYGRRPRTRARIARLAAYQMKRTGSCLVVVNTKEAARDLYRLCENLVPEGTLFHLSTDMCASHRADTLGLNTSTEGETKTILGRLKNGLPVLCVSTQLIEAGVDADFGCVIRFLAGLDSVGQVAGRCNRHGRRDLGNVFVVRPEQENLTRLTDIEKGIEAAKRVLDEYVGDPDAFEHNLVGTKAISTYYKYYFFERKEEMTYRLDPADERHLGRSDTLLNLLSSNIKAVQDLGDSAAGLFLRQSFMTAGRIFQAIDAPTEGVVVPYGREGRRLIDELERSGNSPKRELALIRKAQRYTVSVYPHVLQKLEDAGAVQDISAENRIKLLVDDCHYHARFGLSTEPD